MERGPPDPTAGLAAATSGVAQPQPKGWTERIVQAKSVLTTIRVREVRVIEDVEEFGAELQALGFAEMEIFCQRKIEIPEARIREHIPAHISEVAEGRRHHDGVPRRIAAIEIQSGCFWPCGASVSCQGRCCATRGHVGSPAP